jgi:putative aldouronate transport system substrate-binding protein
MGKNLVVGAVLFLIVSFGVFAGGGAQPGSAGQAPSQGGPVKLSVAIVESLRIEDYETNVMTRMIEKGTNTDLDFILFPSTDYINKLNLMVMAGGSQLPDIIIGSPGDAMVFQWAQEGAIIPLTKWYEDPRMSPNLHEAVIRTGVNFFRHITSPDGEIYGIPWYNQSSNNEYRDRLWYYKPWLEKLGVKAPETTEDFRELLRLAAKTDLNGNGKNDEIGMTGVSNFYAVYYNWFRYLMGAFIYAGDSNLMEVKNGTVSPVYNTNEWREGLKYIRSLVAEGLINQESLTQDENQCHLLLNNDPVRVFSFVAASPFRLNAGSPAIKSNGYYWGLPLKGPKGAQYSCYEPSVANIAFMISANCRNPDAAFSVGDFMVSRKIGIMQRWGEEGVDWDYPKNVKNVSDYVPMVPGSELSIITYNDGSFWAGTGVTNRTWRQAGPFIREYGIADGWGISPEDLKGRVGVQYEPVIPYQKGGFAPKEVIPKLIFTREEAGVINEILQNLKSYVTEMTAAFLSGNRDIDANWSSYLTELNNIGIVRAASIIQKTYDRMYK